MGLNQRIKAVLIDIDGCLNSKTIGAALDLPPLQKLQQLNLLSDQDPNVPSFTINTGRALNYAEVFAQILNVKHFFVVELGAAIARLAGHKITVEKDAKITYESLHLLQEFQDRFLTEFPQYRTNVQRGKLYMTTILFEPYSKKRNECNLSLQDFIQVNNYPFEVDVGMNFINIIYAGINKGTGLKLLLDHEPDWDLENLAGIGDSDSDWEFLSHCGFSACPANASDLLRSKCNFVAKNSEAAGTLEIIEQIIAWNKIL